MNKAVKEVIKCCGTCSFCTKEETELLCGPRKAKTWYDYQCAMYVMGSEKQRKKIEELLITCEQCGQVMNRQGISETQKKAKLCEGCLSTTPIGALAHLTED